MPAMARRADPAACAQQGAALLILLLLLLVLAGTVFVSQLKTVDVELEAQRKTAAALAEAKQALLGYAVKDANRPGSLPCPDANNDGEAKVPDDYSGQACKVTVGRLPWKTLGLSDLRDGSGERLWYALSPKFSANNTAALNSAELGKITIKDSAGNALNDGGGATGAIAVVIAPGSTLVRKDQAMAQDRTCTVGVNCDAAHVCTAIPFSTVPICDPVNYLDVSLAPPEDNADSLTGQPGQAGTPAGFIAGPVRDPADVSRLLINDRILAVSRSELFSAVRKRIFAEIRGGTGAVQACSSPPAMPTGLLGLSGLPWAATSKGGAAVLGAHVGYPPAADIKFAERASGVNSYCQWTVIHDNGWDDLITYEVSQAFAPGGSENCGVAGVNCLVVNGVPNAKARVSVDGTDFGIW
jgi:hypothetical protein